jgi:hypothetical protein
MQFFVYSWIIAGTLSGLAILLSIFLIYKHLRNYTNPDLQRYIVRILIMVPVYATDSFLSLRFVNQALWWDLARDCYEAYCIYCFFSLMVTFVTIESLPMTLEEVLEKKEPVRHPFPFGRILPPVKPGGKFLLWCYRLILQYVFVKPFISILSASWTAFSLYGPSHTTPGGWYLSLTLVENSSVVVAMYFLVLFYVVTSEELQPFSPMGKFLCVKAIIFFSFWQGVAIIVLQHFHLIPAIGTWTENNVGDGLQDFLICVEMFIIAIIHHKVFPYAPFRDPSKVPFLYDRRTKRVFSNPSEMFPGLMKNFL